MSIAIAILTFVCIVSVTLVGNKQKGKVTLACILINSLISSWIAIGVLRGNDFHESYYGGMVFGAIQVKPDSLSAWFILLTNFTIITGILYGNQYLRKYNSNGAALSIHYISYLLNHTALLGIFFIQNGLAFICVWEIMALSAFLMVIFEHGRMETLKAGINYLVQSHISIIFLTLGFIWVYASTGSFDFSSISYYFKTVSSETGLLLFLVFFIGFAIKAGFVPFHTWLPHAHPAAPSHISGVMSGVIVKTGIYGILRLLLLMPENHLVIGYFILLLSVLSGIYGVLIATIQHNVKRLLAYHTIENIGIIGIGIGIGAIGSGLQNSFLAFAGYAGALLHTLNHSLFKSLLFFSSGNVYQSVHTLNIERMGGLIKKMPHTAILFLIASMAICGLPPFNGFISEFLIYSGLFKAISTGQSTLIIVLSVAGLSLIGGLALLCFTKAFGVIFLGTNRQNSQNNVSEASTSALIPQYMIMVFIVIIGLFPQVFIHILRKSLELFVQFPRGADYTLLTSLMQKISFSVAGLIVFSVLVFFIRKRITRYSNVALAETWNCGYSPVTSKLQYTASSYVRSFSKLIRPLIITSKTRDEIDDIIPGLKHSKTHYHDRIESGLIDFPVRNLKGFLGKFRFLQNGSVQFYVLYGVVFIAISIIIPLIIFFVKYLVLILKQV